MAHSVVVWKNTPDTWEIGSRGLTSFEVKHLIEVGSTLYTLSDLGEWEEVAGGKTVGNFTNKGIDDPTAITKEQWGTIGRPVKICTWTDNLEFGMVEVESVNNEFIAPDLELTVSEYRLLDKLERPLKLLTYTDGEQVPVMKTEHEMVGVGTRIMKRGE